MVAVLYRKQPLFMKVINEAFKKYIGLSPLEYRTKYNREMALS